LKEDLVTIKFHFVDGAVTYAANGNESDISAADAMAIAAIDNLQMLNQVYNTLGLMSARLDEIEKDTSRIK
jgi:hypothetical protein